MVLTCPECGARYEIEGSLIPREGRRVQCTACNHLWQHTPGEDAAATDEDEALRAPPPLAEEVRTILREEAERETRVRRVHGLVDIGAEPAMSGTAFARPQRLTGRQPDAEATNATLRAAAERAAEDHGRVPRPGRGGFRAGLVVGLAVVGLGALIYAMESRLSATVPAAAPALERYVGTMDDLRVRLDGAATRATDTLSGLLASDG